MSSKKSEEGNDASNEKQYDYRIPNEAESISIEVPEAILEAVDKKSENTSVELKTLIREGVRKLMAKAFEAPAEARGFIRSNMEGDSSGEDRSPREDIEIAYQEIDLEVSPNERMYLHDALEALNDPAEKAIDITVSTSDFLLAGIKWAAEKIETSDITPEEDEGRGTSSRRFEKIPGQDRGGKVVNLAITQEGKNLLDERAKEFHTSIKTSQFTRECVRRMYEWVLEEPEEALEFILEEQDYYQPPRGFKEYQYGYQVRLKIVDKRRVQRAHQLLNDRFREKLGRRFKQREFLQGVARYGIEKLRMEDSDIPVV